MSYLLFFFYLCISCWIIGRINFFKEPGLNKRLLIVLFLVRVTAGLINTYINLNYYLGTDASVFQQEGIDEYHLLFHNATEYFTNIFHSNHNDSYSGFMESSHSYWNDTRSNLIVKMLSIFNIFSGKNFYINTLFYNFFIFFGAVSLYKIFIKIFPSHSFILTCCIFLLPSVIYFTGGIHRDGLIFLAFAMVMYQISALLENKKRAWMRILLVLIFLFLILLLRNFVFITIVPALTAWIVAARKPKYGLAIFTGIYLFVAILFFSSSLLGPKFDLPGYASARQIAFVELAKKGASAININPLYPNFRSFLNNTPQAINHSLMRPYLTEHLNFLYIPAGVEILIYEMLLLLFIFFRRKNTGISPIVYFCCFFSISIFLVIGYTIPIIGAIVRYRSIYFPLILIPVACYTDWSRVRKIIQIK
ncbi:MAG: hypothetical protein ABI416_17160 [Ginsengibacter sp.]